ncbi:hypothetical protein TPHV1_500034 [Treponema phagedenis]|uniref:Uncharacterized protein n=1 Tax=Treponema phagedenis TaxID=162 RepID=A0A0B7GW80_TREPH|nr:hypothetical protein TPHV1_500034 [Treponema phagedenis]
MVNILFRFLYIEINFKDAYVKADTTPYKLENSFTIFVSLYFTFTIT